ncbi:Cleft lip and palate transmembrane 1 [Cynara cardunculus var. scolymus]|uniref:Cleft lip and palate transmembrane 1 n=1 Tax=Cynara cardunculus var. scolymus TaxID=59895 RepID=A0A118K4V1_CYNCS|nr:Cleft lip and palate transmembrane 1 [Cynara cardunculus var. scolymus]
MTPPAAVEGGDGGGHGGQPQQQQGFGQMFTGIIRVAVIYYFASKFFSSNKPSSSGSDPAVQISNLFQKSEPLDMWFYLSEHDEFNDFGNEAALIWHESNIPYAVWGPESTRTLSLKYYPSEALQHNGSLFAHVFFARSGYPVDPSDPEYQALAAFGLTHPVVTYLPKSKANKKKSLLGNSKGTSEDDAVSEGVEEPQVDSKDDGPVEYISYWKPNITINLVDDFTRYSQHMNIEPTTNNYYPTIFFNEFWLLRDKLIAINDTVKELALHLEVAPISMTKWQLFLQIDQSFQIHRSYGSMLEGEADELKRVFVEGNPYLLGITMVVSLLHSVFDFLAFKNDIQFWNKNKSMEGLSAKSVVVSFFCQLVVFLYLLDNDTSWMILASSGVGCCIESGSIPKLKFTDRDTYAGNKTKEYDDLAMKYLSYVLFVLVACSSVYSLMYETHKSWYSWILSSLTSCVYMFGFIMMCPQLFINYKLKSVAHMPWRQMTYKFLNTIIDDLFAFVIKMPILHRLSVFRDDVIFLIYLYQRWAYPVDKKRVNEFGFGGEDEDEAAVALASGSGSGSSAEEKKTN